MSFFEKLNHQWWGLRTYYAIWILLFAFTTVGYILMEDERIEYVEALVELELKDEDSFKQLITLFKMNGAMTLVVGLYFAIPLVITLILVYIFENQYIKFAWDQMFNNYWTTAEGLGAGAFGLTLIQFFDEYDEKVFNWNFKYLVVCQLIALAFGFWVAVENQGDDE